MAQSTPRTPGTAYNLLHHALGTLLGGSPLVLGAWAVPFTMLATIGLINAINMSDGADGVAGTLCITSLLLLSAAALHAGNTALVLQLVPLLAAVIVFLGFNLRAPWRAIGHVGVLQTREYAEYANARQRVRVDAAAGIGVALRGFDLRATWMTVSGGANAACVPWQCGARNGWVLSLSRSW